MIYDINRCSRCGKKLNDLRLTIRLDIFTERLKETGAWEEIPNLTQVSTETLCPECFDRFVDAMATLNIPHEIHEEMLEEAVNDVAHVSPVNPVLENSLAQKEDCISEEKNLNSRISLTEE